MGTLAEETDQSIEIATRKAEEAIKKILLSLEQDTHMRVDHVNIDTRNYANCGTEIFLK